MNFELVSLDGVKFKAQAYSVILPTASGQITLLAQHEPLLSVVVPGIITIRRNKNDADTHLEHYATYGGVLEVTQDSARVLVDEATHGEEVSIDEAKKAHEAAAALLRQAKTQIELDKAQALVDRQAVRLGVAQLHHRTRRR